MSGKKHRNKPISVGDPRHPNFVGPHLPRLNHYDFHVKVIVDTEVLLTMEDLLDCTDFAKTVARLAVQRWIDQKVYPDPQPTAESIFREVFPDVPYPPGSVRVRH